ncbi:MAG: hypothetical protein H6953_06470 [Chromatiaceae bacterium]|nr:hypothetical protein [Gammaproteobacteria bacterium]MCP5305072.1 hypothetical protein [Chromatiaceae bacterium]MCP5315031.1 hypothetical protein [Chromatiaceae bacterium]
MSKNRATPMSGASQTPTACELVDDIPRDTLRYTPLFCEENIWWLARTLVDRGVDPGTLQVWFLTNHARSIVLLEQRAGKGRALAWDYHVVLQASAGDGQWIFDFDSRLGFPVPIAEYLRRGFPRQAALPMRFRTWVRRVPAADYLVHFWSDRRHMRGRLRAHDFPGYPPIKAGRGVEPVSLAEYIDMRDTPPGAQPMQPLDVPRPR